MFNSPILDVAIGLAFIFLLVSLLVSAVCEMLSGMFKWRAANLWTGIEHLLQSADARNKLYDHPLIKGLAPIAVTPPADGTAQDKNDAPKNKKDGPSYIPARTFSLALIDVIRNPQAVAASVRTRVDTLIEDATRNPLQFGTNIATALEEFKRDPALKTHRAQIDELERQIFGSADFKSVEKLKSDVLAAIAPIPLYDRPTVKAVEQWVTAAAGDYPRLRASLADAVARVVVTTQTVKHARTQLESILAGLTEGSPSPDEIAGALRAFTGSVDVRTALDSMDASYRDLARSLSPLLDEAAGDIDRFRLNVERWFNDGMDRVSGWYKRRTAKWQVGIGLGLAVALNIDALLITRTLWRDPALRQSIVSEAQAFSNEPHPSLEPPRRAFSSDDTSAAAAATVTLSSSEIVPDATVSIGIVLKTDQGDRRVQLEAQTAYLVFSDKADESDIAKWQRTLSLAVPSGQKEAHAFVRLNAGVKVQSLESFRVTITDQTAPTDATKPASPVAVTAALVAQPPAEDRFSAVQTRLDSLGLPIGWRLCGTGTAPVANQSGAGKSQGATARTPNASPENLATPLIWCDADWNWVGLLPMILGWAMTAAAVSFGAPFWFDSLKRIVSIRSAGKAPEERPLKPKEVPKPHDPDTRA
jgi:hypothetical protein